MTDKHTRTKVEAGKGWDVPNPLRELAGCHGQRPGRKRQAGAPGLWAALRGWKARPAVPSLVVCLFVYGRRGLLHVSARPGAIAHPVDQLGMLRCDILKRPQLSHGETLLESSRTCMQLAS